MPLLTRTPLPLDPQVKQADLSLIIGTSLSVQPFARFASSAPTLAIVNLERTRMHDAEERAKAEGARIACGEWEPLCTATSPIPTTPSTHPPLQHAHHHHGHHHHGHHHHQRATRP